ncbi:MAG: MotA/TolQ/ExbB proton channel family protein, partial [Pseudomonas sp.]|nr:MotA/TolQ/ExbB proton channel family protein [Pseudomonas sp.]
GIMEALQTIGATGSASLETVAGPIGHALIATGVGIAVAVPAVLIYNFFLRRLKLASANMDDFAHDFDALAQRSAFAIDRQAISNKRTPVREAS